jgi:hypothetical protein
VVPDGDGIGAALGGDQGAVAEEVVAGAGAGAALGGDQGAVAGAGTGDVMGVDQGTGDVDVVAGAGTGDVMGGDQGTGDVDVVAGAGAGAALGGDQGAVAEEVVAGAGAGAALGGDQGAVAGTETGDAMGGDQGSGAKDVLPTGAALGGDQGEFAGADGVAGLDPTPVAPQDAARSAADMGADAEVAGVAVAGGVGNGAAAGVDPTPVAPHDAARPAADMAGEAVVVVAGGAETGAGSGVEPAPVAPQDFAKSSADLGADAEAVAGAGVALGGDQGVGADAALGEEVAGRGDCPVDCRALSFSMGPHRDFPAAAASDTCSVRCSYTDLLLSLDGKGVGLESGAGVATGPVKSFMAAHCLGTAGADTADAAPFDETGTLLLPVHSLTEAQPVGKSVAWLASNGVVLAGAGIGLGGGDPVACAQVSSTVSAMLMALVTSKMPQRAELPLPLASSVRRWLRN